MCFAGALRQQWVLNLALSALPESEGATEKPTERVRERFQILSFFQARLNAGTEEGSMSKKRSLSGQRTRIRLSRRQGGLLINEPKRTICTAAVSVLASLLCFSLL